MNTLITGANGMLGSVLSKTYTKAVLLKGKSDLDLTKFQCVKKFLKDTTFDTIIHCAAYTDLGYCEKNKTECIALHSGIVPVLQSFCKKLIYISTNPTNSKRIYYESKKMGEKLCLERKGDLIIRTNIYGDGGLVKWAVDSVKQNKSINGYSNVIFNPVSVSQLSSFIHLEGEKYTGVINICSNEVISKYNFLKIILKKLKLNHKLLTPMEIKGDLDLTIPAKHGHITYDLNKGVNSLCENLNPKTT